MKKNIALAFLIIVFGIVGTAYALNDQSMKVKMKYGAECKITETCDDMLYVDCGAAVDGPAYYLDMKLEVIGTSGGLCMQGCTGAPEEWAICYGRETDGPDLERLGKDNE